MSCSYETLSFNTLAMDEILLHVLDSFWLLLEEQRQWRVTERKYVNCKEAGPLHHTFLLGRARFTAQPSSALGESDSSTLHVGAYSPSFLAPRGLVARGCILGMPLLSSNFDKKKKTIRHLGRKRKVTDCTGLYDKVGFSSWPVNFVDSSYHTRCFPPGGQEKVRQHLVFHLAETVKSALLFWRYC